MRPGATWTFTAGAQGDVVYTVTSVIGDQNHAVAIIQSVNPDGPFSYHWDCLPEGMSTYDSQVMFEHSRDTVKDLYVTDRSGFSLPAASQLTPGATWGYHFKDQYNYTKNGTIVSAKLTEDAHGVATASDRLTVIGKVYDAIRIEYVITSTSASSISQMSTDTTTTTEWFVRGIGLVGYGDSQAVTSTLKLKSYSIP